MCVVLVSSEVLTPELAASGGGRGCGTRCRDVVWFGAGVVTCGAFLEPNENPAV